MNELADHPVVASVEVTATPEATFDFFVNDVGRWWPLSTHSVLSERGKPAKDARIEPFVGGRVAEFGPDGECVVWGIVREFMRPARLAFTWQVAADQTQRTLVEVRFEALERGRTRVTLVHSGWSVWGAEGKPKAEQYARGWKAILRDRFGALFGARGQVAEQEVAR